MPIFVAARLLLQLVPLAVEAYRAVTAMVTDEQEGSERMRLVGIKTAAVVADCRDRCSVR